MTEHLMTASFALIIAPALIMLVMMLGTDWNRRDNPGGRAIVGTLFVVVGSSLVSIFVLILPEAAAGAVAVWIRIGVRLAGAAVMWSILALYLRAQREGRAAVRAATGQSKKRERRLPSSSGDDYGV